MVGRIIALLVAAAVMLPTAGMARPCPSEAQLSSISSSQRTSISFTNEGNEAFRVYWIDYDGKRKSYGSVLPGTMRRFDTFATHPWVVVDADDNCRGVWFADTGGQNVSLRTR
jgi:hypothetical protein